MVGHDVFIFVFTHLDQFMEVIMLWVGMEFFVCREQWPECC